MMEPWRRRKYRPQSVSISGAGEQPSSCKCFGGSCYTRYCVERGHKWFHQPMGADDVVIGTPPLSGDMIEPPKYGPRPRKPRIDRN